MDTKRVTQFLAKGGLLGKKQISGGGFFGHWWRKPFFWLVLLPVLLSAVFFGLIASDMYVSEAQMVIRNTKGISSGEGSTGGGIFSGSSSMLITSSDAYVVHEYIRSPDLLRQLESEIGFRAHYEAPKADPITRLSRKSTDEELLQYYQSVVSVSLDSTTGIIKVKVRAYDPEFAHRLAQKIIKCSEALVNRMSERAVQDTIRLANEEQLRAEGRVNSASQKLKEFRMKHADFNPSTTSANTMSLLGAMEGDLAKANAELAQLRSYMREDSPQVVSAKSKVDALAGQIASEQGRLTGVGPKGKASQSLEYDALALDYDFAQKSLVSAMQTLEQARITALSKTRYLEAFVKPNLPEKATYPERLMGIGLTAILSLLFYGIAALAWAAIKEHSGF